MATVLACRVAVTCWFSALVIMSADVPTVKVWVRGAVAPVKVMVRRVAGTVMSPVRLAATSTPTVSCVMFGVSAALMVKLALLPSTILPSLAMLRIGVSLAAIQARTEESAAVPPK